MQNRTYYNFIKKLLEERRINTSKISKSVKNSPDFKTLETAGIIGYRSTRTGGGSYETVNLEALKKYFKDKFPEELRDSYSAVSNIKTFRNTKAGKRKSQNVILLRGFKAVEINGAQIDLTSYTNTFGTFSVKLGLLKTPKVCIVENLDSYLLAEQVINKDYVFIHTYGGLGKSTIKKIIANEILFFPDYDFKGLQNYLMTKQIFEQTELFVPENYGELFNRESRSIKTKQGREQNPSNSVKISNDELVVKIRNDIYNNKRFLEQQALFSND